MLLMLLSNERARAWGACHVAREPHVPPVSQHASQRKYPCGWVALTSRWLAAEGRSYWTLGLGGTLA